MPRWYLFQGNPFFWADSVLGKITLQENFCAVLCKSSIDKDLILPVNS